VNVPVQELTTSVPGPRVHALYYGSSSEREESISSLSFSFTSFFLMTFLRFVHDVETRQRLYAIAKPDGGYIITPSVVNAMQYLRKFSG